MTILLNLKRLAHVVLTCGLATSSAADTAGTAAHFEAISGDYTLLRDFLQSMPKGADLHIHADGAVYAENFIEWSAADSDHGHAHTHELCWSPDARSIVHCSGEKQSGTPNCMSGQHVLMATAARDNACYDTIIDALSMRNFQPNSLWGERSGHDQFFSTFGRFGTISNQRLGLALAEDRNNAALENTVYIEPQITLDFPNITSIAGLPDLGDTPSSFAPFEAALLEKRFKDTIDNAEMTLASYVSTMEDALACGTPAARPGCEVGIRLLGQSIREQQPEDVFGQIMLHFYVAHSSDDMVGVNFVAPEDGIISLRDYELHMEIFGYFAQKFPDVKISLHAGELWLGLVRPKELRFHIRQAIEKGGASRIGHGVDVGFEDDSVGLMQRMIDENVTVEINLSSNEQILRVYDDKHPFPSYLNAGVPVVLATDDAGVSRIDLTSQYQLAVERYGLSYEMLKTLSRRSVSASFLTGTSIWADKSLTIPVGACAELSSSRCDGYVAGSDKAKFERALEQKYEAFEARFLD